MNTCTYVHVFMYIYMYMYINVHMCTYVQLYTHREVSEVEKGGKEMGERCRKMGRDGERWGEIREERHKQSKSNCGQSIYFALLLFSPNFFQLFFKPKR